ncbi:hypothetical protein VB780_05085 [Leptolyngbya sp. CCNP1308]|uniref:hypothetical protein n=1 Tax=Leptolyngbya sp. CCNP1308 TaxID=3110255 RepID=UPI002B21C3FB|nr:hypothetical protein [Leptolyngbya sp. CCNP1308]MEA5447932.1 hypothetical protein [Leptolyngbya sp. CCNP1308]
MAFPFKLRVGKRSLRWSGGGLLALFSIGLHGVLLAWPVPETTPEPAESLTEITDSSSVVGVVRLPAAAEPSAEAIAVAPAPQATQAPPPKAPPLVRSAPPAAPAAPQSQVEQPEAAPPAPPTNEVTLEPVPPEPLPATLEDRLRDPAQYEFNQQAKSLVANEVAFHTSVVPTWLETEGQGLSDTEVPVLGTKLAPLQVPYPIATCLTPAPAEGLVGVIVNASGQLVKEPVLLDSTGYTVLDEKALELALQRSFEPNPGGTLPNPQAHWLPIQVEYSGANCRP